MFEENGGELLLLGEPGAGKTTLLLELARDLLERATVQGTHPLPVIFNLTSWAQKRMPLEEWLIEELTTKYQVPRPLATEWVEHNQFLLLLDGLDEVAAIHRSACIEAINCYRKGHGMVPLVIASRRLEYLAQRVRLLIRTAVIVEPLSAEQIETYLSQAGEGLAAVRTALAQDASLQEMASTPLMLSTIAFAYRGMPLTELLVQHSVEQRRRLILEQYTQRVLERQGPQKKYYSPQTKQYLAWLAEQMMIHGQTEFYVERVQPDWLPEHLLQRFRLTVARVFFAGEIPISAGVIGLFRGDATSSQPGLFSWLGEADPRHLLGWMAPGLGGGITGLTSLEIIVLLVSTVVILLVGRGEIPTFSMTTLWQSIRKSLQYGLMSGGVVGIFSGLLFTLAGGVSYGYYRGAGVGLYSGVLTALVSELLLLLLPSTGSAQKLRRPPIRSSLSDRLLSGAIFSLYGAVGSGSVYIWQYGHVNQLVLSYAAIVGLFCGLVFSVANEMQFIPGLGTDITPAELVQWSWNWGKVFLHVKKGGQLGSVLVISVVLALASISSLFYGVTYAVRYGLIFGVIVGGCGSIASILTGIFSSGWSSKLLDERQLLKPNEGIRRSLRNALLAVGLFAPIGGGVGGLAAGLAFWLLANNPEWGILLVGFTIVFGLIFALHFGTLFGGIAVLEHYLLRYYLWRLRSIPWNYVGFLNYCVERILLRKVGGGYIFAHRLLLEYFASLSS